MSAVPSHFTTATCTGAARVYRRRRPERTALYRLVQQYLETWLARRREGDPDSATLPCYVERELRAYLECGILACGFARARCGACGHDLLVAFSCKGRGLCPSCTTRRMAATAAHLVEQVFPQVPVRQWVISFPRRLRYFLHRDPVLLGRVRRCALRTIEAALRRRCPHAPRDSRYGAVSFVQRFGSALNAHTHLHNCVTDGVFSLDADGTLRFHPAPDLNAAAVSAVQRRIRSRALRLAVRYAALTLEVAADLARWGHGGGFSLHAAVRIEAANRAGLERLLRYCAPRLRPARTRDRTARHSGIRVRLVPTLGLDLASARPRLPPRSDPEQIIRLAAPRHSRGARYFPCATTSKGEKFGPR